jgi:hypothetical protein
MRHLDNPLTRIAITLPASGAATQFCRSERNHRRARVGTSMAITRIGAGQAIAGLCIGLIACVVMNRAVATATAADYSVEFDWADERDAKAGWMSLEMSVDADITKITDAFAYTVWQEQDDPKVTLNTLILHGNETKCISFANSKPKFPGDFKSCATVSIDNDDLRTIEFVSGWDKRKSPLYKIIVSIKFTMHSTPKECTVKLISASRNYNDKPGDIVPLTRVIKEDCKRS